MAGDIVTEGISVGDKVGTSDGAKEINVIGEMVGAMV